MTDKKVIYGGKWRKAREKFLAENPFCKDHEERGLVVLATVVDHIVPHRNDLKLFWRRSNWQPLCKACHDRHKQRLEKSGRVVGFDDNGFPIDPNHHWRKLETDVVCEKTTQKG